MSSNQNLPDGVTSGPYEPVRSRKTVTVEFTDLEYDNGYGDQCAELYVDCIVINGQDVEIESGQYNLIDNDGGIFEEVEYEEGQDKDMDKAVFEEAIRLAGLEVANG